MKSLTKLSLVALILFMAGCSADREDKLSQNPNNSELEAMKAQKALAEFIETQKAYPIYNKYMGVENNQAMNKTSVDESFLSKNADYNFNNLLRDMSTGYSSYDCAPTDINAYVDEITDDWTNAEWAAYYNWGFLAFDYHFIYDKGEGGKEYYGSSGDYTNAVNRTFNSLNKFWDPDATILLFGAHGKFFSDTSLIIDLFEKYRDFSIINPATTDAQIASFSLYIKALFGTSGFESYTHPLLTFNAFAADDNSYYGIHKKIVMGDGVQQAYDDLGYSDVASQAILAHEYGHQVQFLEGVPFVYSPTGTRYTELMADALAAYYLTHKRGGTLNWKRVQEFLGIFFDIGDCSFNYAGHHGTPNQRMRAAKFGYDVAVATMKKGQIMSASDFIDLFDDNYDDIVED